MLRSPESVIILPMPTPEDRIQPDLSPVTAQPAGGIWVLAVLEAVLLGTLVFLVTGGLLIAPKVDPGANTDLIGAFFFISALALVLSFPGLVSAHGRWIVLFVVSGIAGSALLAVAGYDILDLDEIRRWSISSGVDRVRFSVQSGFYLAVALVLILVTTRAILRLTGLRSGATSLILAMILVSALLNDLQQRYAWDWHHENPDMVYLDWHHASSSQPVSFQAGSVATNDPAAVEPDQISKHLKIRGPSGAWQAVTSLDMSMSRLVDGSDDPSRAGKRFEIGREPITGILVGLRLLFWPWENHVKNSDPFIHVRRFRAPRWLNFTLRMATESPGGATLVREHRYRFRRPRPPADNVQIEPWIQSILLPMQDDSGLVSAFVQVVPDDGSVLGFDELSRLETYLVVKRNSGDESVRPSNQ